MKLSSPDILPWSRVASSSTADATIYATAQSWPQGPNYSATYLNNGYWILEITGVQTSTLKLWWKCYTTSTTVVPPNVEPWVWGSYPLFTLEAGQEKVYIINIDQNYSYLKMSIAGLTPNTMGTFSWTFPDGRILPVNEQRQGVREIVGMNGAGTLVLRAGTNIPDDPIPQGNHILRISVPEGFDTGVPPSPFSGSFKMNIEVQ